MVRNYLLIAFRSLFRNKLFSLVNILGLALGIGSSLLIFLWVNDELQFDHFHQNIDRIFRVMENQHYSDGKIYTFSATPAPMAPYIKQKFPEIEKAARFTWSVRNLIQYGEKSFDEQGHYVDPDFLEMFDFKLVDGDASTALESKNNIVITRSLAEKFFNGEDPMGKVLILNTKNAFTVSGVIDVLPVNSSIRFDYLLPFQFFWDENESWLNEWGNNNIRTFVMLSEGADKDAFSAKLKHEIKEHNKETSVELFIQPYGESYLYGAFENGVQSGGRIEYVRIFFIVALFVLFIACINFTNLATAQASKRAREVGLRKAIGAAPRQLFRQFMGESFLMVVISSAIAILLCIAMIPVFNGISGKELSVDVLSGRFMVMYAAIVLVTGFVAGAYPAFFLSEFRPAQVLKGQLKHGRKGSFLRKSLVIVQFSLSIILIISTIVVFRQMRFMQNKDIGFKRENVFYMWMDGDVKPKYETIRKRLLDEPGVVNVSASSQIPIDIGNSTSNVQWEGKDPDESILFSELGVDGNFIQCMGMEMVEGRAFDPLRAADSAAYLVNQKAAEKFGFADGTAGKELTFGGRKGMIVGVVKDFNFGSLHDPIDPLIMYLRPDLVNCMLVRANPNQLESALSGTEKLWKEYAPGYPLNYSFLEQDWENFYSSESQRGQVFNALATLSIFISCLGLFGLSAFSAESRTKELGIRKALGATVPGLVRLMSREFTTLVLVAACFGCPLGWYLMSQWLQGYAYHIDIDVVSVVSAAVLCFIVALTTVAYHSIKVATGDPVKALRYE